MIAERKLLSQVARAYNVQASYHDVQGQLRTAPPEAILAILRMLGAPVGKMSDLASALRQRRQFLWQRVIDPVIVVWDGAPLRLKLRLPSPLAETAVDCQLIPEAGEKIDIELHDDVRLPPAAREIDGMRYVIRRLLAAEALPLGYHILHLQIGDLALERHLFVAPSRAYRDDDSETNSWGIFCPVYALASHRSWGAGDFTDLTELVDFVSGFGGHAVGTLPLFAAFLDEPFNPSPYAPVSRLFWNEFYLDVTRIPELQSCVAARSIIQSSAFAAELAVLRGNSLVDYRRVMALKRRVLETLLHCLLERSSERRIEFERFVAIHPRARDYAAFRAKTDGERKPWQQWDAASRDGALRPRDDIEHIKQYHLYVQWQCEEQMRALAEKYRTGGAALYLDFPLGVNRDGYDVWREREGFALDASGGAPPDDFFVRGQNWGFPPLHPDGLRRQAYRYYIESLRHHLQYARFLRLDHVMGLHRSFWIPQGCAPTEGVYVRYPAEEFYAVLNLESHRHQAQIIGENLGTVPPYVNVAMERHRISGMYVGQFCVRQDPDNALAEIPPRAVVSLNTHDTATFAGFWTGADIDDRRDLGLLDEAEVETEQIKRAQQRQALMVFLRARGWLHETQYELMAVVNAWLLYLAAARTDLLLINLEDLWLEALPQNVPGTWQERPNWRRKARFSLEQICALPEIKETLQRIHQLRREGSKNKT